MLFHQSAFDSSSLPFFPNSQTINKPNHPSSATNSISKSPFSSLSLSLMAKATKESNSTKPKPSSSHPPYSQMICDAIVALKERTGSSQYAISKFIEEKHKPNLPPNFKKTLLSQLKRLVAAEKLVKIKNSFKISTSSASAAAVKPKPKPKATVATKLKPAAAAKLKAAALTKSKPKPKQRPVKVATKASPGKKMKMVKAKKPKSIKSPVKKAVAAKKVKKAAK